MSKTAEALKLVMSRLDMSATFYALEAREIERFHTKTAESSRAGECDECQAGGKLVASEIHGDAVERHSLRFMDRDCPCESERQPITDRKSVV